MNARVPTLPTPTTLLGHIYHLKTLQQVAPIVLQRCPIGEKLFMERVAEILGLTCPKPPSTRGRGRRSAAG